MSIKMRSALKIMAVVMLLPAVGCTNEKDAALKICEKGMIAKMYKPSSYQRAGNPEVTRFSNQDLKLIWAFSEIDAYSDRGTSIAECYLKDEKNIDYCGTLKSGRFCLWTISKK